MLCKSCQSDILDGSDLWGYHHLSGDAADGCTFCSILREDVSGHKNVPDAPHRSKTSQKESHWWSVHKPGRIRESPDFVNVVFTPVAESAYADLPVRSFHLYEKGTIRLATPPKKRVQSGQQTSLLTSDSLAQIKEWIHHCHQNHHDRCRTPDSPAWVPTRLVNLEARPSGNVSVVKTSTFTGKKPRYVTLSHCWGDPNISPMLRLVPTNKQEFMDPAKGIAWDTLPRNFRNAIEVARALGIDYIWIDSLCIVQGEGGDFEAEGQLMHRVYRNSYCNLAAVDSSGCQGGFFPDGLTAPAPGYLARTVASSSSSPVFGGRSWHILPSDLWESRLLRKVLYRRGWVFQERMLSPRLLHFAGHQIYWDCSTFSACEALPDGLPDRLDTIAATERHWRERLQIMQTSTSTKAGAPVFHGSADDSVEAFWARAVRDYTSCELTNYGDRLSAIWGIAKLVRDQLRIQIPDDEYGVGLWRANLAVQLAWRVADSSKEARRDEKLEAQKFPSWSWASLVGEIETADRYAYTEADRDAYYRVKDHSGGDVSFEVTTTKLGGDYQPALQRNELAIKGRLIRANITVSTTSHLHCVVEILDRTSANGNKERDGSAVSRHFEVFPDTADAVKVHSPSFLMVLAARRSERETEADTSQSQDWIDGIGLVLRELHERPGKQPEPCYQRIGSFRFQSIEKSVYDGLGGKVETNIWLC